jgi:hypothetical protein
MLQDKGKENLSLVMSGNNQYEPSLVRYRDEDPYVAEFDATAEEMTSSVQAMCNFMDDNMSVILAGFALLLMLYLARPQVPDARFRGRFRRQLRQLKEALAEKPAEREDRIEKALTVKVRTAAKLNYVYRAFRDTHTLVSFLLDCHGSR